MTLTTLWPSRFFP